MTDTQETGHLTVADAAARFEALDTPKAAQADNDAPDEDNQEDAPQADDETPDTGPNEEADDAEQEPEEEVAAAPDEFEVDLDGEKLKVSRDELIKGYQRQSDYTRKQQEAAEKLKQDKAIFEQYEAHISGLAQQYQQKLAQDYQQADLSPQQWEHLKQTDPEQYAIKWIEMQGRVQEMQRVAQEQQIRTQQLALMQRQQAEERLQQQEILLAKRIPAWADSQAKTTLQTQISEYLHESGFTPEEVDRLADARLVETAYKAMMYDKLQKSKPLIAKKIAEAPKVARTAAGTDQVGRKRLNAETALKQLRKTGSLQDAAKAFEARM